VVLRAIGAFQRVHVVQRVQRYDYRRGKTAIRHGLLVRANHITARVSRQAAWPWLHRLGAGVDTRSHLIAPESGRDRC